MIPNRRAERACRDSAPWRLIVDVPADGAWNMAVDEALLECYACDSGPGAPTLRLYGWRPAALSLGKSQPADGSHDPGYLRAEGIDLVRRPTGGRAVLHEHERTYAVVGYLGRGPFPRGVRGTYAAISSALLGGLRRLGVSGGADDGAVAQADESGQGVVCFSEVSVHEIVVSGLKIVGSAQLRRRGAFLQHGSILVRSDAQRLGRATGVGRGPRGFTDLERVLGRTPADTEVDAAVVSGFEEAFGVAFSREPLCAAELDAATRLRGWKYLSAAWTLAGQGRG